MKTAFSGPGVRNDMIAAAACGAALLAAAGLQKTAGLEALEKALDFCVQNLMDAVPLIFIASAFLTWSAALLCSLFSDTPPCGNLHKEDSAK